jgi:hypothetical protein
MPSAGVATALVEASEEWGRAHGAVAVLDTYVHSDVSMPFWEQRMGYAPQSMIVQKSLV